ncbi:MAG: hypothetical protein ACTSXY_12340 [Promethearchaeota archaeon]
MDKHYEEEQPLQQQPINELQNSIIQNERVSNFISQTSPVSSLENINYMLQGYAYNHFEKEWKKVSDGIPNNMKNDIIQFITPDLSEDTRMTNLNADQINGIMETVIYYMKHYLYNAPKEMTIKDLNKIFWIVIKAVFITITRSREGVERNRLYNSLKLGGSLDNTQIMEQNKDWWKFWN